MLEELMDLLLKLLAVLAFVGAFAIGFFTRKFRYLFVAVLVGLTTATISLWFYFTFTPPDVGLAVIAVFPALVIVTGIVHLIAALLGGLIGTLAGKRFERTSRGE